MSTVVPLASGPITTGDVLTVDLVTPPDAPAVILVRWPAAPSVADPRRFPAMAVAVIQVMDQAMSRLAEIRLSRE
jgi:hypothetical protein